MERTIILFVCLLCASTGRAHRTTINNTMNRADRRWNSRRELAERAYPTNRRTGGEQRWRMQERPPPRETVTAGRGARGAPAALQPTPVLTQAGRRWRVPLLACNNHPSVLCCAICPPRRYPPLAYTQAHITTHLPDPESSRPSASRRRVQLYTPTAKI